jgi:acetyl-CoA synthetase
MVPRMDKVVDFNMAEAEIKWFVDAKSILLKTVLTDTCKGRQNGYHFEPNDPSEEAIHISYTELHQQVSKWQTSCVIKVQKGDRMHILCQ